MSPILGARGGLAASASGFTSTVAALPGDYDSIASVTLSSANSVTFSSIPQDYKHLQIRGISNAGSWIQLVINSTTSANYSRHELRGSGSSASADGNGNGDLIFALGGGSTYPTAFIMDVFDYTSTNKYKTTRALYGSDQNGSGYVGLTSGAYLANLNAVTSLTFYSYALSNLASGTTIALYGVK